MNIPKAYQKEETIVSFIEKVKAENQKELDKTFELQRILEELTNEAEHPQIYRIRVRSNL